MRRLAILGSTGSIGRQTLEILRAFPDRFEVIGLACEKNIALLEQQIAEFKPRFFYADTIANPKEISESHYLPMEEMACHSDIDLLIIATSGRAGLSPTLSAIGAGKTVAIANKEVLVMAGEIITAEAELNNVEIMPIDSEHSAIWQCLRGEDIEGVSKLILTASGGPFRLSSYAKLTAVTPEEALNHPTWQMGKKVTIDSATLMNKGMEVIEAHWLFDIPFHQIEVIIHPQSIVHSIVEFNDGSAKAQLSLPDMRLPIQYALTYPERWQGSFNLGVDLTETNSLDFQEVDLERFPCLRIAREVGERGGTYPAVLSAADEVAVQLFLEKKIGFMHIPTIIAKTLDQHQVVNHPSLEDILLADEWAREITKAGH